MKKILIIDDDEAILEALRFTMETSGYRVETETHGEKVLKKVKDLSPDLILLDFLLPDKNGGEIVSLLKRQPSTKNLPVIIFSAHSKSKKAAKDNGADDFIDKPFDIDDLLLKIKKYI